MHHYLDFAATSAVRPPAVAEAMSLFLSECGASPGRGGYEAAVEAARVALRCRKGVQRLLGLPGDPGRVAFLGNGTQALNAALWGLLRPGDRLVVTQYDHNAVLRPAAYLARRLAVDVRMVAGDRDGGLDLDAVEAHMDGARLLVVNAASNVLGSRLPLGEMADRAHAHGALVLVDAAQGAGHFPMQAARDGADLVAFTGHKGMLGPQGTGGLWVREGVEVEPLYRGGTGSDSGNREMPEAMPDRLEAGTLNAPGLAGLLAGLSYVLDRGVGRIHARVARLKGALREGLSAIPGVTLRSPAAPDGTGIVTFTVRGVDPATLAARLDREWGVAARAGLHCAPECHRVLGTLSTGALRLSLGWASTDLDVEQAVRGVGAIVGAGSTVPVR